MMNCKQQSISKHNGAYNAFPLKKENIHWPLKIFTLSHFSLIIDGKPLKFMGKAQYKPLELIKALVVFGGRDVSKHQLADTLYPEVDGDKALRALFTTIHRLRKLIRNKDVIQLQGNKLNLNAEFCWVDVWILERLLGRIDIALVKSDIDFDEISYLTNKVLQLYRGKFLKEDVNNAWVLTFRERLSYKFLRKLILLGEFWEQKGHTKMAIDIYLHALEEDRLVEEFYQRLMICYNNQGFGLEAMSVYERCHRTLNAILGIKPSTKTKAIRDQLIN